MCGWQVKLCDPLVTRGPYLSALEIRDIIKRYTDLSVYFTCTLHEVGQGKDRQVADIGNVRGGGV